MGAKKGFEPIKPMLAKPYTQRHIARHFPPDKTAYVQPLLDGVRALIYYDKLTDTVEAYSRTGKPLVLTDNMLDEAKAFARKIRIENPASALPSKPPLVVILDGELYRHGTSIREIKSAITEKNKSHSAKFSIKYYICDFYAPCETAHKDATFYHRLSALKNAAQAHKNIGKTITLTTTKPCKTTEEALTEAMHAYTAKGFQGITIKNRAAPYSPGKRSPDLLHFKPFREEEYPIVEILEGRGQNAGKAVFVCRTYYLDNFKVTSHGNDSQQKFYWQNRDQIIGRKLTVKYQEKTKNGKPKYPIAVGFKVGE